MNKKERYSESSVDESSLKEGGLSLVSDERDGIDLWISLSIEGKRRDIIKKQLSRRINRMRTLRFHYHV